MAGKQAIIGHLIPERFGGLGTQDFRFRIEASLHPMWAMTYRPGQAKLAGNGPDDGAFGLPTGAPRDRGN